MWVVGKIGETRQFEAQYFINEDEKLAIQTAIQADADKAGIAITLVTMTDADYNAFMSQ